MSAIPGIRFDITGASGSQGLLSPKASWRCYVLPRGGFVSQDSTGTTLTFDSSAIAGRFAAGVWIQAGLAAANIRQVAAVGGNSLTVSGAALTVAENDRIYIIGTTEPTISGGSVTYSTPSTTIRQRDDDGADLYTNSMVTTNSNGLVQFFSEPAVYDCIVQDGNQALQGSLIDVPVGVAEGVSTSQASVFGSTVTINAAFGVTGWVTFGQTVTCNANVGITGTLVVGATFTANAWATFGASVTVAGALGVTGTAAFGATLTVNAGATISGMLTGTSATFSNDINFRRAIGRRGTALVAGDIALSEAWGSTASVELNDPGNEFDARGMIAITAGGAGIGSTATVTITWKDGAYPAKPRVVAMRTNSTAPSTAFWLSNPTTTNVRFDFIGTPVAGSVYGLVWITLG